jgi:chaperonin GroEL
VAYKAIEDFHHEDPAIEAGIRVIKQAMLAPSLQISVNAGMNGETIIDNIKAHKNYNWGYDYNSDTYCDFVEAGIIDATKGVRCSLEDAASVAGLLLTTVGGTFASEEDAQMGPKPVIYPMH